MIVSEEDDCPAKLGLERWDSNPRGARRERQAVSCHPTSRHNPLGHVPENQTREMQDSNLRMNLRSTCGFRDRRHRPTRPISRKVSTGGPRIWTVKHRSIPALSGGRFRKDRFNGNGRFKGSRRIRTFGSVTSRDLANLRLKPLGHTSKWNGRDVTMNGYSWRGINNT